MKINSISVNNYPVKHLNKRNITNLHSKEDSVSFSGKEKKKSGKIPFRLNSKYQDNFHNTGLQIYVRKYLDLKNKGLSEEEILKSFAGDSNLSKEELFELTKSIEKIKINIDKMDASFEEIIPSLKKNTYYRGIYEPEGNKGIDVINNAEVGDIIQPDSGYPFFSTDYLEAETFARSIEGFSTPETAVLMEVVVPKGVRISRDLSFKPDLYESNVVLPRGVNYKVLDKKIKDNKTYITLEYIDCATDRGE